MISLDKKTVLWAVGGFAVGFLAMGAVWGAMNEIRGDSEGWGVRGGERRLSGQNVQKESVRGGMGQQQGSQGYGIGGGNGMGPGSRDAVRPGNCLGDECLAFENLEYPVGDLSDEAKRSLDLALADEYKAKATYESVIGQFGSVRPFNMIVRAEQQHINALLAVYDRYGLEAPVDATPQVASFANLQDACKAGVDAEVANAALYKNTLLPTAANYEDIVFVFTNLMNASQNKHLPAFERCQ